MISDASSRAKLERSARNMSTRLDSSPLFPTRAVFIFDKKCEFVKIIDFLSEIDSSRIRYEQMYARTGVLIHTDSH